VEKIWEEEHRRNETLALGGILAQEKLFEILGSLFEPKLMHHVDHAEHGFLSLLCNDRRQDELAQMCGFFHTHFPSGEGLQRMRSLLKDHLIQLGTDLLAARNSKLRPSPSCPPPGAHEIRVPEKQREEINGEYVMGLISLYEKYTSLLHPSLRGAIADAFSQLLGSEGETDNHADLINGFCDCLLRGKTSLQLSSDREVELCLENAVQLFAHLPDKDLFLATYRDLLAKRLLTGKSSSDEMERHAISLLKLQCRGGDSTARIEGMLLDIFSGRDQRELFRRHLLAGVNCGSPGAIDFEVQVLSQGRWPALQVYDLALPPAMGRWCQVLPLPSLPLFSVPP
jgi:hypothetical protein